MSFIRSRLDPISKLPATVHSLRDKANMGFFGKNDACNELMTLAMTDNLVAVLDYAKFYEKAGCIWNALTLYARFVLQVSLKEIGRTFNHLVLADAECEAESLKAIKFIRDISKNDKYKEYAESLLYLIDVKLPALHAQEELIACKKRYSKHINEFLLAAMYEHSKNESSYLKCLESLDDIFDGHISFKYSYLLSIHENLFKQLKLPERTMKAIPDQVVQKTSLLNKHTKTSSYDQLTKPQPRCAL